VSGKQEISESIILDAVELLVIKEKLFSRHEQ